MTEIPKAYEPQSVEDKWYEFWQSHGCFTADPARVSEQRPAYSIVIPPPNVTGMLHMGHVLNNTIQDILARKARMDGREVLWLPGTDHAGIATQVMVEKKLKKELGKSRHDVGREEFLKHVWEWKEKHGGIIINQLKKLGASCDWSRERFTMDEDYSKCVQRVFVALYKKGLIYRGKRMVNWCPVSQTALSDEEVIMEPQKSFLWYFKVQVAEVPDIWLTIATTRPETIPGDTAVAVNPKDPRYAHLIGKHVIRPLPRENQARIPIIGDEHIDIEFGTGVLKVTPAHDKADFEIGQRHSLEVIDVLNADATMNSLAGEDLAGLDRFEAREKAAELLREMGVLEKEEAYENNVGFSERAKVPIEPRLSEQWFLKYPSVEQARTCVSNSRKVRVVFLRGDELPGHDRAGLRRAALQLARDKGWLGSSFPNADTGWQIHVRRRSLSHAFSSRNTAAIRAIAAVPELIQTAVLLRSESHEPPVPDIRAVHHFMAALRVGAEDFAIPITVKELANGQMLYDHKAKKIAPGGKPPGPHPLAGKLGLRPAPGAEWKLAELLSHVNGRPAPTLNFYPDRWAKTYDHWMTNIQDWCISRQLWWGHRIPVWRPSARCGSVEARRATELLDKRDPTIEVEVSYGETLYNTNWPPVLVKTTGKWEPLAPLVAVAPSAIDFARKLEALGFEQEEDVLDTWFSSWLWPFATMSWPEQTETLKKFYPTTDLVTGPDIIFFWVARMIMAGYEFMGEPKFGLPDAMPFRNVYFTGIIRDKKGRKMSKTLGNSPDPLDLIAKYGADALRFGTMRSAPLGLDVLFDEKDVELGRNFCNKLWNACRFRQMQGGAGVSPAGEGVPPGQFEGEIDPALLTNDDRWILNRLGDAIREINEDYAEYRFTNVTKTLYRFFWTEYCDWYVEASKAVMLGGDEPRKANTLAVIDFILGNMLRLFHPFLPFITEELWHGMGFNTDLPEDQGGKTIMTATWPKAFDADFRAFYGLDETVDRVVAARNELVTLARNLRSEFNLPTNKKVRFLFKPAGQPGPHDLAALQLLLNAETLEMLTDTAPKKGTPMVTSALGELYLPLEGLVDVEAERARLQKEIGRIEKEIEKVEAKLGNPNFADKVPAEVLQEHRERLVTWQAKLESVRKNLAALG